MNTTAGQPTDAATTQQPAAPVTVAVTGAAGQIGYSLLFRIASGALLGPDQPVRLRLLEVPGAMQALEGVVMELDDCAFDTLAGVDIGDVADTVFEGANIAMLVGAMPRRAGMERADLLQANGAIFSEQGVALNRVAASDVRVVVTGNPANTNALIALNHAPDIPRERFTALTRLDHNRALAQLARAVGAPVGQIRRMTIWGNHSNTQVPDLTHALVGGRPAPELVPDEQWVEQTFIPTVAKRGSAIIAARGSSSAASAANATLEHVRDWVHATPADDWVSMAVPSDGSYGVDEGLVCSFPCTTSQGDWSIVPDLDVDEVTRGRIEASVAELRSEAEAVRQLGLL